MATYQIKIRRGLAANVAGTTLAAGEPLFTTDTGKLYIGTSSNKVLINDVQSTVESANKLTTSRAFSITGDITAPAVNFDGSAAVTLNATLGNSGITAGTYSKVTFNAKGLATAGATLAAADIPSLTLAKITDAGTAAAKNVGTSAGNVLEVGADGKVASTVIPAMAITEVFVVANQAAMLALSEADPGDVAIRTDTSETYILKASPYSTLSNWVKLLHPESGVQSVNGKTGAAITLNASDVGAEPAISKNTAFNKDYETSASNLQMDGVAAVGSVDTIARGDHRHPSDTSRAPLDSPAFIGIPTAATAAKDTNTIQLATTAFVMAQLEVIDGGTF